MANSQNTIREIIVANVGLASETTLKTFTASADSGKIGVFAKDGGTAAFGKDFVVALKTDDSVIVSDVIVPSQVSHLALKQAVAEVQKVVTVGGSSSIAVPAVAGERYEYIVDIRLFNHGSLSVENFYLKHGHFILTQTAGPLTAQAVVDGLISQLNKSFSKEPGATATTNPLFTFTRSGSGATSALVITAKEQPLELGKKEGRQLEFDVVARVTKVGDESFGVPQPTVAVTTPANPGTGTGKQIAKLEFFYRGGRGDVLRGVGYPYDWTKKTKTLTDQSSSYDVIELKHFITGDGLNALKMPKSIIIACRNGVGGTDQGAVLEAIEVFTVAPAPAPAP